MSDLRVPDVLLQRIVLAVNLILWGGFIMMGLVLHFITKMSVHDQALYWFHSLFLAVLSFGCWVMLSHGQASP